MKLGIGLAALAVACGCTSGPAEPPPTPAETATEGGPRADQPMTPVTGRPLAAGSGLRLVVTGGTTFVFNVDSGARTAIGGLPSGRDFWSFPAGRHTIIGAFPAGAGRPGRFYVLDGTRAKQLADGLWAFAAHDGRGVWMTQPKGGACVLREIGFDRRDLRAGRTIPCDGGPARDTPVGLVATRPDGTTTLLNRDTGEQIEVGKSAKPGWQVLTTIGDRMLVRSLAQNGAEQLSMVNAKTWRSTPLPMPPTAGRVSNALVSPDGRSIAIRFVDPAWPGPRQYLDMWLLELPTLAWSRMPSMPAPAAIKTMSMAWTGDGQLVLTGEFPRTGKVHPTEADYDDLVVVWRPGEADLSVKRLPLPDEQQATLVPG